MKTNNTKIYLTLLLLVAFLAVSAPVNAQQRPEGWDADDEFSYTSFGIADNARAEYERQSRINNKPIRGLWSALHDELLYSTPQFSLNFKFEVIQVSTTCQQYCNAIQRPAGRAEKGPGLEACPTPAKLPN